MLSSRRSGSTDTITLVPTEFRHGAEGCGQRIESPHPHCQGLLVPFLAGERLHRRFATIVICLGCKSAWREVAA